MNALNPGDACSEVLASPCCAALQIPYDEILDVKVYDSDTLGGDDVRDCTGCSLLLSMAWLYHSSKHDVCVMSKADQCVHGCPHVCTCHSLHVWPAQLLGRVEIDVGREIASSPNGEVLRTW